MPDQYACDRTDILIREFASGDEVRLADVFYHAIHQTAAADYSPQQLAVWAPVQSDPGRWAEKMRSIQPFVVEIGGVVVGYADVQRNGYIDHFYVSPQFGRRGVGKALMNQIHQVALSNHAPQLFSSVSLTARPFFEKFDFVIDAAQQVVVDGIALRNFRMSKTLTPT